MTTTCTRRLTFCAGHRVLGHENKCANVHGHNYIVHVEAEADALDALGRVVDFGMMKETIGGWLDSEWDHAFLIWERDTELIAALQRIPGGTHLAVVSFNPTAENIANHLLLHVAPVLLLDSGVRIRQVIVEETENCQATATDGK